MTAAEAVREHETPTSTVGSSVLAERWEIDGNTPLPAFHRPGASAFACIDRRAPSRAVMALVATSEMPTRIAVARALSRRRPRNLLALHFFGPYRPDPRQPGRMTFVYDRPPSGAVALSNPGAAMRGADAEPWRRLLGAMIPTLRGLEALRVAHRAIHPGNLWFVGDGDAEFLLGDGLASPAGWDQPAAYEPVERAMAGRSGRGEGGSADDIFALGVTALALAIGEEPGRGRDEDELLEARLLRGSYTALTEGIRVPMPAVEALRGMLADDPADRWTSGDIEIWLDGGRPRPRLTRLRPTSETPFLFGGKGYREVRSLAWALSRDLAEGARALRGGGLTSWSRYTLQDEALAKGLSSLVERASERGSSGNADDAMVARAAFLLDPSGPIRYRGAVFVPDGFGPALAEAMVTHGNARAFAEAMLLDMAAFRKWARRAASDEVEGGLSHTQLLRDPRPGFGLERCLYEANLGLHCLSPLVRDAGIFRVTDLLPALEVAARTDGRPARPMDRHLAAFLAAREGKEVDALLPGLADRDQALNALATLALLAYAQSKYSQGPVPLLAAWVGASLSPVIEAVKHRASREALERDVRREIEAGDLSRLLRVVGDAERLRRDREGFATAKNYWRQAERELERLRKTDSERRRRSRARGSRIATIIALSTALVSVCVTLLKVVR